MFPCRKPKPPVNWAEVGRAGNPRAGHLSFVIKSCDIIGQSGSLSKSCLYVFLECSVPRRRSQVLSSPSRSLGWLLSTGQCALLSACLAVAFCRTQVSLWAGRPQAKQEEAEAASALLAPGIACRRGTMPGLGFRVHFGEVVLPCKLKWEISLDAQELTEKVKKSLVKN